MSSKFEWKIWKEWPENLGQYWECFDKNGYYVGAVYRNPEKENRVEAVGRGWAANVKRKFCSSYSEAGKYLVELYEKGS